MREAIKAQSLRSTEKAVLLALCDHMSPDGTSMWPSVPTLAKETGFAEVTVRKTLGKLRGKGLIVAAGEQLNAMGQPKGGRRPTKYEFCPALRACLATADIGQPYTGDSRSGDLEGEQSKSKSFAATPPASPRVIAFRSERVRGATLLHYFERDRARAFPDQTFKSCAGDLKLATDIADQLPFEDAAERWTRFFADARYAPHSLRQFAGNANRFIPRPAERAGRGVLTAEETREYFARLQQEAG